MRLTLVRQAAPVDRSPQADYTLRCGTWDWRRRSPLPPRATGGLVTRRTGKGFLPAPDSPSLPAPGHSCLPDASPPGCSKVPGGKTQSPGMPVPCPGFGALLCYPSITTTLPQFGQFLTGNRFAEGKATKLSSAWAGCYEGYSRSLSCDPSL